MNKKSLDFENQSAISGGIIKPEKQPVYVDMKTGKAYYDVKKVPRNTPLQIIDQYIIYNIQGIPLFHVPNLEMAKTLDQALIQSYGT